MIKKKVKKNVVNIKEDYIPLCKLLKFIGVVNSGSEAGFFIQNDNVYVNKVLEKQKRKKVFVGDEVQIREKVFVIEKKGGR